MRKYCLLIFFFFWISEILLASDRLILSADTVKIKKFELPAQGLQPEINPYFNLTLVYPGLFINKTFGVHPLLNLSIDCLKHKNTYKLVYEVRYGRSRSEYQILDNDSLKSTNVFNCQYVGLEYERKFDQNPHHEFYGNVGFGYDWIWIPKKNNIRNNHAIGGIGLNIGVRYCFYFKEKHGPNFGVFYHFTDFRNKQGTALNSNSIVLRIGYNFGKIPPRREIR